MTRRLPAALAGLAGLLALGGFVLLLVLGTRLGWVVAPTDGSATASELYDVRRELPWMASLVIGVLVGAGVAARRPRNPIPWLLMATGLGFLAFPVVVLVVTSTLARGSTPWWTAYVAWVGNWIWMLGHGGGTYLLLLFPDGRNLSTRWRLVAWIGGGYLLVAFALLATYPTLEAAPQLDNPFGLALLEGREAMFAPFFGGFNLLQVLGIVCIVLRYVRSRGEERQQMKWFALAAASLAMSVLGIGLGAPRWIQVVPTLAIVAAILVAVTRYRLYEIDRVVSRTLTYLVVTTLLGAVYVAGTVGLGGVVHRATGGAGELVVAATTLAVAALFRPLRRRVQQTIDRRFNRASYDAQRTVARFGQHLRDEVDLGTLSTEMREVAVRTMQPSSASVWLVGSRG